MLVTKNMQLMQAPETATKSRFLSISSLINSEREADRSRVAWVLVIVTAAYFLAGLYAAFSHRGLFADGSYYLVKVVQQQDFYVVFPPRKLVQALQQAPVIPLVWMTTLSLADLGKVHSLSMLLIPILLCALCWPILPPERKSSSSRSCT
jgi:hypothetical protein